MGIESYVPPAEEVKTAAENMTPAQDNDSRWREHRYEHMTPEQLDLLKNSDVKIEERTESQFGRLFGTIDDGHKIDIAFSNGTEGPVPITEVDGVNTLDGNPISEGEAQELLRKYHRIALVQNNYHP